MKYIVDSGRYNMACGEKRDGGGKIGPVLPASSELLIETRGYDIRGQQIETRGDMAS